MYVKPLLAGVTDGEFNHRHELLRLSEERIWLIETKT